MNLDSLTTPPTKVNPNFISLFAFLLVGLVWSGGHAAWMVALAVLTLLSVVTATLQTMVWQEAIRKAKGKR